MKKESLSILIVAGAVALIWVVLWSVSRLHYRRSVIATLAEGAVRCMKTKKSINTPERAQKYLEQARERNLARYCIPKSVKFHVAVAEKQEHGMQVFYMNAASESDTLILYLHGGAYVDNPLSFHWKLCDHLARGTGAQVVLPIYPKLPDHSYRDAYAALMKLYQALIEENKHIVVMGDSSGGGLALGLAQKLRDEGGETPERLILLSPWLDVSMENRDMEKIEKIDPMHTMFFPKELGKLWAGEDSVHDALVSPLYGDLTDLGRISLFVGTREILCPDILRFSALLYEKGIEHDLFVGSGLNHVYPAYPIPEGKKARKEIINLIQTPRIQEHMQEEDLAESA